MSSAARRRNSHGFTLLETVIALAVWGLLALGASRILVYASHTSARLIERQSVFENARAALDALSVNIQMADTIVLETDTGGVLRKLTLTERAPDGKPANYIFYFDKTAQPGEAKYHRLEFGLNDEFASRLAAVRLTRTNDDRLMVTVVTDDSSGPPLTLSQSLDIAYKQVTVNKYP